MAEAQILVAKQQGMAQVRVLGRATFKISRELREFAVSAIREGLKCIVFDFSGCRTMDSTFMGVLAMIGVEGRGRTEVVMVNATPSGYQELGRIRPLGGQSWTAPIVAEGKLLIRNKQALACLDLR